MTGIDGQRSRRHADRVAPALLLLAAFAYYVAGVLTLAAYRHGDVFPVSYARLLATAHTREFLTVTGERRWPTDAWATAADWQRFSRVEDRWAFRAVARECGAYEAHPPGFFWLMNAALSLGVSDHWVTTVLNLPVAVVTGLLVTAFTYWLTHDRWCATLAGVCWCLSPPVMVIGDNVRSPTWFAPLTLLVVWLTLDWARQPRVGMAWRGIAAGLLGLGGMLIHFQMGLVLAVCGLFLLLRNRRAAGVFILAQAVAAGLFLACDAEALGSLRFNREVNPNEALSVGSVLRRVGHVGIGALHYFAIEPKWTRAVTLVIPMVLVGALCLPAVRHRLRGVYVTFRPGLGTLTALLLGSSAVLYVGRFLPPHAHGVYYFPGLIVLTPVWLGIGLRFVLGSNLTRTGLLLVLLASSAGSARLQWQNYRAAGVAEEVLARADVILSDMPSDRGVPRVVAPARGSAAVLVADRARLAREVEPLLRDGRTLVLALSRQAGLSDELGLWLAGQVARGWLVEQPGLVPFSPEFVLYRTP